ncbi:hypothetical protein ENSA7_31810 [Enhygromyxa salina]|uniref:Uncharacterized protein n=2 Tax=Enhygromyxa salina TaxID=215803 RepID=A0A2S9YQ05_9BACT|nr:hypothetical protein ENSA7_31810 [Enhygromyxa salina]
MPYTGTWIGPALTLSFVGPWVIVRPTHAEPGQAPIELRVRVERREGDAFALQTSVAGVLPADFLRPADWTMLVEDQQLAIAMGDEPLTAYVHDPRAVAAMTGPTMLDQITLPEQVPMADAVACLEQASSRCRALEAGGPLAGGCRELAWATCVAALGPLTRADSGGDSADPTVRAAWSHARMIDELALTLRYAKQLERAADVSQRDHARAVYVRALERAATQLDELTDDGPLADHPMLAELLDALQTARDAGLLD